ncbi:MAG: hypothetical protein KatS3mg022_2321 [Armatimonadota bacterium]|nr:MAG: hypothetical protein KatS3mg022_2321 [Armatimonadota bacterium]
MPENSPTFRQAVEQCPDLGMSAWQPGLQALGQNSQRVRCSDTRRLTGSVFLGEALKEQYPGSPRWDYGIGWRESRREVALWIEVHPAHTGEVETVLRKLQWLKWWLAASAPALGDITPQDRSPFHWIATDSVSIPKNSPQARRLSQSGLRYPVRILQLGREEQST